MCWTTPPAPPRWPRCCPPADGLPGAGHQPPPPWRPARRSCPGPAAGTDRGRGAGDVRPAGAPRRCRPGRGRRGTGGAGRVLAAGGLAAGSGLCPAPVLDTGGPGRRDPGGHAHPDRRTQTALPPHSSCPTGTWPPASSSSSAAWACIRASATDAYAAAALAGISLREAAGQLDALHGEGLLTETGHRRYGMHDLIRSYARDLAATDQASSRQQALDRLLDFYQHTAALSRQTPRPPGPHQARTSPAGDTGRGPGSDRQDPGAGVGPGRAREPACLPGPGHRSGAARPGHRAHRGHGIPAASRWPLG